MGSGTSGAESSTSTSDTGTTGNGAGTGDGSVGGSAGGSATTDEPESTDTSASDSGTSEGLDGSTGSTSGAEGFPFEGVYTGSFNAPCQIVINGALAVEVDAAGVISGTATAAEQTASVTGNVDALGSVAGSAMILGLGACQLTGDINIALVGGGTFSCPANCTGTWVLSGM